MNAEIERYYMFRDTLDSDEGKLAMTTTDVDAVIDEYLVLREIGTPERPLHQLVLRSVIGGFEEEIARATSLTYRHKLWKGILKDMVEKARG